MRVKFDNHIDLCKRIRHPDDSNLLIITTMNDVYTVECNDNWHAKELFDLALADGYINVSHLKYSN